MTEQKRIMWQRYGNHPWGVFHYIPGCSQSFDNIHEVTLKDGTLVARFCSECEYVTYVEWASTAPIDSEAET